MSALQHQAERPGSGNDILGEHLAWRLLFTELVYPDA